jgi:hypothetical protein
MLTAFISIGIFLLVLNFLLVFLFREHNSFTRFPGMISALLFTILCGYVIFAVNSITPEVVLQKVNPKAPVDHSIQPKIGTQHSETPEQIRVREEMEVGQRAQEVAGVQQKVALIVSLLLLQSFLAAIGALIGIKVLPPMKKFYIRYLALHCALVVLLTFVDFVLFSV